MSIVTVDNDRIAQITRALRELETQVTSLFPGRAPLIRQLILALICREHVLIFGRFGTGKSDLLATLFGCFSGLTQFRISLTKFMTESHTIGNPNFKHLRDTGEMVYPTDGLLAAQFVEFDEFFDGSDVLLRTLLGILNERQFLRGKQCEKAQLHTAVAATNADPRKKHEGNEQLGAVIDRFLFIAPVMYLLTRDDRMTMYRKYVRGGMPTVSIPWSDIEYLNSVAAQQLRQVPDEILEMYDDSLTEYLSTNTAEERARYLLSDRRRCKMLQVVQAAAILEGRTQIEPDDVLAVGYALDPRSASTLETIENFQRKAQVKIQELIQKRQPDAAKLQRALLENMLQQIPAKIPEDAEALLKLRRELFGLQTKLLDTVRSPFADNTALHTRLKESLARQLEAIRKLVDTGGK